MTEHMSITTRLSFLRNNNLTVLTDLKKLFIDKMDFVELTDHLSINEVSETFTIGNVIKWDN